MCYLIGLFVVCYVLCVCVLFVLVVVVVCLLVAGGRACVRVLCVVC